MKRLLVISLLIMMLVFSANTFAEQQYDILQQMFLDFSELTTPDDIKAAIEENGLYFHYKTYNGKPKYLCVKVAYEDEVSKLSYGKDGDHFEIHFDAETQEPLYASYFNYSAFLNDYKQDYEAICYLSESWEHRLGYYGHNSESSGQGVFKKEVVNYVPFETAEEAMQDVLSHAN